MQSELIKRKDSTDCPPAVALVFGNVKAGAINQQLVKRLEQIDLHHQAAARSAHPQRATCQGANSAMSVMARVARATR